MLAFDPRRLSEYPTIDWDGSLLLKISLATILNSHFFTTFSSFSFLVLAASRPQFRVPLLLM